MASNAAGVVRGLPQKFLHSKNFVNAPLKVYLYSTNTSSSMSSKLPNLPVPKLNQTLSQYIRTVKPLLTKDEFVITEQVANSFGAPGGVGEKLQHMLEKKGVKEPNWLSEWWIDSAYLSYRLPVVVHSNPALVFPKQNFYSQKEQFAYAAKLIIGSLHYKAIIDGGKLKQDYMGKNPLDMSQYTKVFNGCRIPGLKTDSIRHATGSTHIVVVHNNHFFKMEVYGKDGKMVDEADILNGLLYVAQNSSGPAEGVGFFTTECRNVWGIAHQELKKDAVNSASLQAIEDSILVMCLDKENKTEDDATASSRTALQLLHGYGADNNSGNRWFDKTLQLIVGADGVNGLCYEHSPTEGPPIANLSDFIVDYVQERPLLDGTGCSTLKCERLNFNLSPGLEEMVRLAKRNIDVLVQDLKMNSFTFDKFGKEDIKALKLSPDSFIQIAIQMAFIRLHGHPAAHYESASTRQFHGGRTETIRSCLPEIVDFATLHLKSNQGCQAKYKALQTAIKAHKDYVQMAISGQGIDRHLLGLKRLAIENGTDIPTLYLDAGYSTSNNWRLSTSQVAAVHDMVMCYGPVVPDGYGCCYNPRNNGINFAVSSFNSNPTTCAKKFGETLQGCLEEIRDIASSYLPSKL